MSSPTIPLILAIETATEVSSVALFQGADCLGSAEQHGAKVHARVLSTLIAQVVKDAGFALAQLDAVAISRGPGSYTGLRVGVSTAKGLCMALEKPLLSFGSLDTLAAQVQDLARQLNALIVPMIDARRMEVYTRTFAADLNALDEVHAQIVDEDTFVALLQTQKVIFVGNGAAKCKPLFQSNSNAILLPAVLSTARSAGTLLLHKWRQGEVEDLAAFEPFYLKEFATTTAKNLFAS